jgi:hypothetical protein
MIRILARLLRECRRQRLALQAASLAHTRTMLRIHRAADAISAGAARAPLAEPEEVERP